MPLSKHLVDIINRDQRGPERRLKSYNKYSVFTSSTTNVTSLLTLLIHTHTQETNRQQKTTAQINTSVLLKHTH